MQKLDALVVAALEVSQTPLTLEDLRKFLPADHVFLTLWPQVADTAILHPLQALNLVERLDKALALPGDVIECGIYQGVTSILMAKLMDLRQSDKKLILCDSFQGLPSPDRGVDASQRFQQGAWAASRQDVEARLAAANVLERCIIHEGWFADTLSALPTDQQFCLAYIDADLYSSTVDCLAHVWPRLVPQGIAVFDDYHHPSGGVRKAVDEFFSASGEVIIAGPASQSTVIKGMHKDNSGKTCHYLGIANGMEIVITFDDLRQNPLFCAIINRRLQYLKGYTEQLHQFAGLLQPGQGQAS